jgi:sugar/nucleoside kinase (ribokinase family)
MKKDILAVGSVALDSVETPFGKATEALGGSATFFSAAARFFVPVSVVAVVGKDFPAKHLRLLKNLGVDTRGIEVAPGKTFRWQGYYDYDLNSAKTLRTELNVFQDFVPKLSSEHKSARSVFLANIDPDLQYSVLNQTKSPSLTACDTMNFWIGHKKESIFKLLKHVDIFLCNDAEARELTKEYNLLQCAKQILKRGPKLLVIKKGEHGVLCFSKNFLFLAPAFLLESVMDPTGAGDTFAGGFIGYLASRPKIQEADVRRAIIYGSVLASYNVESFSLYRLAKLKQSDLLRRFELFRKATKF